MIRILVALSLAAVSVIFAPEEATANGFDRCYSKMVNYRIVTVCQDGKYAETFFINGWKVSTWYHRYDPTFKVVCRGLPTRSVAPVPICKRPPMHTMGN